MHQHRFRMDRYTDTPMSYVVNYIETDIHLEQHVLAIFLVIQPAFNTIDLKQVKKALLCHNEDRTLIKWYNNYLTHRNPNIEVKGSHTKLSTGFP